MKRHNQRRPLRRDKDEAPVAATARAALYLRVSTGRQADSDLSIPDQRRQIEGYCLSRGWEVAAEFVEPGNTATDDRRPSFQAIIDAAMVKPPTFNVILVHSFSRFFRDQFQFESQSLPQAGDKGRAVGGGGPGPGRR